jgi:hypothetical protein
VSWRLTRDSATRLGVVLLVALIVALISVSDIPPVVFDYLIRFVPVLGAIAAAVAGILVLRAVQSRAPWTATAGSAAGVVAALSLVVLAASTSVAATAEVRVAADAGDRLAALVPRDRPVMLRPADTVDDEFATAAVANELERHGIAVRLPRDDAQWLNLWPLVYGNHHVADEASVGARYAVAIVRTDRDLPSHAHWTAIVSEDQLTRSQRKVYEDNVTAARVFGATLPWSRIRWRVVIYELDKAGVYPRLHSESAP